MGTIYRRVELLANVAIVLVAVMIGAVLVRGYFFSRPAEAPKNIAAGTKVSLPGVEWERNGKTLVLALQKGCHFCSESAPFYQRLVQAAAAKGVKIVAVLPQPQDESRQYLEGLAIPVADIRQAALGSLNVKGTPTLILVNDKGEVAASWVGKLPSDKESDVLARL